MKKQEGKSSLICKRWSDDQVVYIMLKFSKMSMSCELNPQLPYTVFLLHEKLNFWIIGLNIISDIKYEIFPIVSNQIRHSILYWTKISSWVVARVLLKVHLPWTQLTQVWSQALHMNPQIWPEVIIDQKTRRKPWSQIVWAPKQTKRKSNKSLLSSLQFCLHLKVKGCGLFLNYFLLRSALDKMKKCL